MGEKTITYKNEEITVFWKPEICIHAAECVGGSPTVFDPKKKPWVNVDGANADEIMATIDLCPSKALSYSGKKTSIESSDGTVLDFTVLKDGPLLVNGQFRVKDADGKIIKEGNKAALCRCGASSNKPFCDGRHKDIGFEG